MGMLDDATTVSGYPLPPPQIHLRQTERHVVPGVDAVRGIILAVLCGACLLIWAYDVWVMLR